MPPSVPSGRMSVRWPRELALGAGAMNMVRGMAAAPAAAGAAPLRRCPHDPQNAKEAPTVLPHFGQVTVSPPVAGTPAPGVGEPAGTTPGASGSDWWARAGAG